MNFIQQLQQNFNKLPKWLTKITKFMAFILLWSVIANISIFFFYQPTHHVPTEFFNICVLKDNKPDWVILEKRDNLPLCQQNYQNIQVDTYAFMDFEKIDNNNNEWQLTTWSDSMGDPFIYHYQIDKQQKIIPLWWSYGGMMVKASYWFFALLLSAFFWDISKKMIKRKLKVKINEPVKKSKALSQRKR